MWCSIQRVARPPVLHHLMTQRTFAVVGRKSKNVAAKKNKQDALRTKLFTRLGVKILLAAKRGGTDTTSNIDLARALKEAYSASLPKENIDRALKKATDAATGSEEYTPGDYEVFGLGGVGIIVRTLTENTNRAVSEIKSVARKHDVKMASAGSVLFQFELRGIIDVTSSDIAAMKTNWNEATVFDMALSCGVDDADWISVEEKEEDDQDSYPMTSRVVTSPEGLGVMQDAVMKYFEGESGTTPTKISITGGLGYLPKGGSSALIDVPSQEDKTRNLALIAAFEGLEDVDQVFHNMKL